ncbi:hypothetical protein [Rummeliibacillus sp. POC4]|uniref:hypothetical protein n=1 Tax=Rummeliibacillus sp. POC4 TaxID=2305899 RepID=UPI000E670A44|nr:hypothetical protein [Rummeliibacillus sp. POC4]RIJ65516.1 hypothetical protein D1606_08070 [Rummeliibacillus sp. POC4]
MPKLELKSIKDRVSKATPGPWHEIFEIGSVILSDNPNLIRVVDDEGISTYGDSDFIAHSRQDVDDLIKEIERLYNGINFIMNETRDDETCDYLYHLLKGSEETAQIHRFK